MRRWRRKFAAELGVKEPTSPRFVVSGLGFRIQDMGLGSIIQGLRFRAKRFMVHGLGFRTQGLELWVQSLGCRDQGLRLRVQGLWFRVQGLGSRVQGLGFRVQGLGFRVQGLDEVQGVGTRPYQGGQLILLGHLEWIRLQDLELRVQG